MTTQSLLSETPVGPFLAVTKKSGVTACLVLKNLILPEMMCVCYETGAICFKSDCQLNLSDKNDFMTN